MRENWIRRSAILCIKHHRESLSLPGEFLTHTPSDYQSVALNRKLMRGAFFYAYDNTSMIVRVTKHICALIILQYFVQHLDLISNPQDTLSWISTFPPLLYHRSFFVKTNCWLVVGCNVDKAISQRSVHLLKCNGFKVQHKTPLTP